MGGGHEVSGGKGEGEEWMGEGGHGVSERRWRGEEWMEGGGGKSEWEGEG